MKKVSRTLIVLSALLVCAVLSIEAFSCFWDNASPLTTCASCHEIETSAHMWEGSGHRTLLCRECHGTALSNGFHSLSEKAMMFVHHFAGDTGHKIQLTEEQLGTMLTGCKRCHEAEYAAWTSGGHSATFAAIFLNPRHNETEQLNADCLRCHGMFFAGTVEELVRPLSTKGPWSLLDSTRAGLPVIPCFTCHQVHRPGSPAVPANHTDPKAIFYSRLQDSTGALYYDRYEKRYIQASDLPSPAIMEGDRKVEVSDDVRQRICLQCHAPNAFHEAGSNDDRTPRGVHEGIGCLACHNQHSNDPRESCMNCHPAISNCGLDVTKMNTSYADKNSPHNIHFVRCADCHVKGIPQKPAARRAGRRAG